jgi:hypothetical protein
MANIVSNALDMILLADFDYGNPANKQRNDHGNGDRPSGTETSTTVLSRIEKNPCPSLCHPLLAFHVFTRALGALILNPSQLSTSKDSLSSVGLVSLSSSPNTLTLTPSRLKK